MRGWVRNDNHGVIIEVEGLKEGYQKIFEDLKHHAPPSSHIRSLDVKEITPKGDHSFAILPSQASGESSNLSISPDLALCHNCLDEFRSPKDHRYSYPFINCTYCGPRFTIAKGVPYDRHTTTMSSFDLCDLCKREYEDPLDRRFHAQPIACPECGPQVQLLSSHGDQLATNEEAMARSSQLLEDGAILAVKGIGGFHFICSAMREETVQVLRERKGRDQKPLAIMTRDREQTLKHVHMDQQEWEWLSSPAAPIVLLDRREDSPLGTWVHGDHPALGVLLPYTPIHHALLQHGEGPYIATSANHSDEALCYENTEALEKLSEIADAFLIHDRPIHIRCDDSVMKVFRNRPLFLRRSRGFVPLGIPTDTFFKHSVLAVGGELKNTIALSRGHEILVSQHHGDLKTASVYESFKKSCAHFQAINGTEAEWVVCDLHPQYLSTQFAEENYSKDRRIETQHHHAHIAGLMAEHRYSGACIGVALDGAGFGPDGTVWGGEVLICDRRDYLRHGRLRPFSLPGGDVAAKQPWRCALSLLVESGVEYSLADLVKLWTLPEASLKTVETMILKNLNSPRTSSAGRLFDGIAALLGLCTHSSYEGQAAIMLELAGGSSSSLDVHAYPFELNKNQDLMEIDYRPALREIYRDICRGKSPREVSQGFHHGLVNGLVQSVLEASERYSISTVALSGGCFFNQCLIELMESQLIENGMKVLVHRQLPPGDGGLSAGQLIIAHEVIEENPSCVWQYR